MASMEDLISTLSDVHAGQKGNDLRDLRAKLTQTLQPAYPTVRPVPPPTHPFAISTNASAGPMPPPAPVSSWNSPPPMGNYLNGGGSNGSGGSGGWNASPSYSHLGQGTTPRQGPFVPQQRELGFRPDAWSGDKQRSSGQKKDDNCPAASSGNRQALRPEDANGLRRGSGLPSDPSQFDADAFAALCNSSPSRNRKGSYSGR